MDVSVNAEIDKAVLLATPNTARVLYADKDVCVLLTRDTGSNMFQVCCHVSMANLKCVRNFIGDTIAEKDILTFEHNGTEYACEAYEIDDMTPDQSESSNVDGNHWRLLYPTYEEMHQRWTDPNSKQIRDLLYSIRKGELA